MTTDEHHSQKKSAQTIFNDKITSSTLRASESDSTTGIFKNSKLSQVHNTTSRETKFHVRVIAQLEEKNNTEIDRESLNRNNTS